MAKQELLLLFWILFLVCDGGRNLYNKTKCTVILQITSVPCFQLKLKILRMLLIYTPVGTLRCELCLFFDEILTEIPFPNLYFSRSQRQFLFLEKENGFFFY